MGIENNTEVFPKKLLRYTLIGAGLLILTGLAINHLPQFNPASA